MTLIENAVVALLVSLVKIAPGYRFSDSEVYKIVEVISIQETGLNGRKRKGLYA